MQKLKKKWGISSNFQLVLIFIVFAITGSSSVYAAKPFLQFINLDRSQFGENLFFGGIAYYILRIILIFPFYQVLLIIYGTLFGQFKFFWNFEKKMLNRISGGHFFKSIKE